MAQPPWTIVGSEAWCQRHLTRADGSLDNAEMILSTGPITDSGAACANALINLARARYRAVEAAHVTQDPGT
jgi:hypothetical protein